MADTKVCTVSNELKTKVAQALVHVGAVEPVAKDLYLRFAAIKKEGFKDLEFFHCFDQTIPSAWPPIMKDGKPNPERSALNSHVVYNRLRRMVQLGKRLVLGTAKKAGGKARLQAQEKSVAAIAKWIHDYKVSYSAVVALFKLKPLKRADKFVTKVVAASSFRDAAGKAAKLAAKAKAA